MYGTPFRRQAFPDDAHDLNRSRARNDSKLKATFERIFDKYNKNFSDIGDEIDLETGDVVVDNGHLAGMRNERDTGSDPTRRFVRAFTQELGADDHRESHRLNMLSQRRRQTLLSQGQTNAQSIEIDDSEDELGSSPTRAPVVQQKSNVIRTHAHPASAPHKSPVTSSAQVTPSRRAPETPSLAVASSSEQAPQLDLQPLLRSMQGVFGLPQPRPHSQAQPNDAMPAIDATALQSLGVTIATQIATFLNQQMRTTVAPTIPPNPWAVPPLTPHRPQPFGRDQSFTPASTYDSLRSDSPSGDMSLWANGQDFVADDIEHLQPLRKRAKIMHSIEADTPALYRSTPEDTSADVEQGRRASPVEVDFFEDARRNFCLLAHGVVNRGYLSDTDIRDAQEGTPVDEEFSIAARRAPRASGAKALPRFSRREDAMIIRLRERENWGWDEIGAIFPDRTIGSLQVRYSRTLKSAGTRSKRQDIMKLVDDEELIASLPEREWSSLDYAVSGRVATGPRFNFPETYEQSIALDTASKPRKVGRPKKRTNEDDVMDLTEEAADITPVATAVQSPRELRASSLPPPILELETVPVRVEDVNIDPLLRAPVAPAMLRLQEQRNSSCPPTFHPLPSPGPTVHGPTTPAGTADAFAEHAMIGDHVPSDTTESVALPHDVITESLAATVRAQTPDVLPSIETVPIKVESPETRPATSTTKRMRDRTAQKGPKEPKAHKTTRAPRKPKDPNAEPKAARKPRKKKAEADGPPANPAQSLYPAQQWAFGMTAGTSSMTSPHAAHMGTPIQDAHRLEASRESESLFVPMESPVPYILEQIPRSSLPTLRPSAQEASKELPTHQEGSLCDCGFEHGPLPDDFDEDESTEDSGLQHLSMSPQLGPIDPHGRLRATSGSPHSTISATSAQAGSMKKAVLTTANLGRLAGVRAASPQSTISATSTRAPSVVKDVPSAKGNDRLRTVRTSPQSTISAASIRADSVEEDVSMAPDACHLRSASGSPQSTVSATSSRLDLVKESVLKGPTLLTTPINRTRMTSAQVRASGKYDSIRKSMLRHSSGTPGNSSPIGPGSMPASRRPWPNATRDDDDELA